MMTCGVVHLHVENKSVFQAITLQAVRSERVIHALTMSI